MSDQPPLDDTPQSETGESSRRTRNRSVSGMTVAQRERKRANDRRSQRASRARTRQHIQHLERELENLRNIRPEDGGDENAVIQELIRRNQELEIELIRLRSASESPLSANSNFSGIPATGRGNAQNPGDSLNTEASSRYLPGSTPPVDNRGSMGPLMTLSSLSVADNFGEASGLSQNLVYTLPNQHTGVDFPRSPSSASSRPTQYREHSEGSGAGRRRQDLRYPTQTNMESFATTAPARSHQLGLQPFVRDSRSEYKADEYQSGGQAPIQPLHWNHWQVDEPSGETEEL